MKSLFASISLSLCLLLLPLLSNTVNADVYDDAVANPNRPAADRERDSSSKPAEVLRFSGIKAGDTVVDLFGGGGYNTELLAAVVGSAGTVYLHNNASYVGFTGDAITERVAGNRLTNVQRMDAEVELLPLESDSVDVIWISMAYHDAYWVNEGWTVTADTLFPSILRVLKPGGAVLVIDHHAPEGTGNSHAGDLHRIDAAFARQDFESHGFRFVAESELLENPDDPLDINVFDGAIQGKTSRFVYRFTK